MSIANHRVGEAIGRIGRRLFAVGSEAEPAPASELSRHRSVLDRVGHFLLEHAIEPTPENYALAYRHEAVGEPGLESAIASMIAAGHARADASTQDAAAGELKQMFDEAQRNLEAVEVLVRTSGRDAGGFGDALEQQLAANPAIDALVNLTKAMIERTRVAEAELNLRATEMGALQTSLADARTKADTDPLTGLSNRRAFERHLATAGRRAVSDKRPLSLAVCDIDLFKSINDTHGHCTGDRVLKFVSRLLEEGCGTRGRVSRHGGEEFVIVFEETTAEQAYEIVDAARRDLKSRHLVNRETDAPLGDISFSAGIASLGEDGDVWLMLRAADRLLYKAKAAGRDQVMLAE